LIYLWKGILIFSRVGLNHRP